MPEWIGKTIGKVRIDNFLARGGMAEVYSGTHLSLDRPVAVKVLHSYIEEDPDLLTRFQREAKVVAGLRHPNIVQIYDYETADGHPFIVMEYLQGPSFAAYLHELHSHNQSLQPAQIAHLLLRISLALDYAHEQGVVHRDIKPGNIILHNKTKNVSIDQPITEQTEPVITDFGLVRIAQSTTQTASGLVSGTPAYMSPEQAQGEKVDHRSDIYSLGVILYEMVAGRIPFEADTSWTMLFKHINEPPPPIPNIQPAVQKVIDRVLAKDPGERYQTCRDLAADYMEAIGLVAEANTMGPSLSSRPSRVVVEAARVNVNQDKAASIIAIEKQIQPARPARIGIIALFSIGILLFTFIAIRLLRPASSVPPEASPQPTQLATEVQPTENPILPPIDTIKPIGLLRFQDGAAAADGVTVSTTDMPLPPEGSQYEVWLIADDGEQRLSIGVIVFDADGKGSLTFVDGEGRNLLGVFHAMEITVESKPDNSPNPSNMVAFSALLPPDGFLHVRHLLSSFGAAPDKIGLVRGLDADANLINELAGQMLASFESGNTADVRLQAESMLNIIVGSQSEEHKDWDGNGNIDDPGDGFGLLLNGNNIGYIQGTFTHADLSLTSPDATENMFVHGEHVKIAATNVGEWVPLLRDQLIAILDAAPGADIEASVRQAVALSNQVLNGFDVNGNEKVEPIPGEGGTLTAYEHAYYMADMIILPGSNQVPAP